MRGEMEQRQAVPAHNQPRFMALMVLERASRTAQSSLASSTSAAHSRASSSELYVPRI